MTITDPLADIPAGNLVKNGSFEEDVVTHSQKWNVFAPGTMAAWNIVPATVGVKAEIQRNGLGGWNSSKGSQWLELDGDENGPGKKWDATAMGRPERGLYSIHQTVSVTAGLTYTLMFDFAARPGTTESQNAMRVSVLDSLTDAPEAAIVSERVTALSSQVVAKSAKPKWRMGTITFVAPADGNVVLEFRGLGQGDPFRDANYDPATDPLNDTYGMFLDNVVVVPVPTVVDLDVDSENTGAVDRTADEDVIEADENLPGVIVAVGGSRAKLVVELSAGKTARLELAEGADKVTLWDHESQGARVFPEGASAIDLTAPTDALATTWTFWIEAIAPSASIADITFTLTSHGESSATEVADTVRATAVAADLDGDTNNDGTIDPENGPSGTDDPLEDVPGERRLELPALGRRIELRLAPGPTGLDGLTKFQVNTRAPRLRVWDAETGGNEYVLDQNGSISWPAAEQPGSIWVGALLPSNSNADIRFTLSRRFGNDSAPILVSDSVLATALAEVMFVYHVDTLSEIDDAGDAVLPPELPSAPFGVTPEDLAAIESRRAARLALDGVPTVDPAVKSFGELENAVANAEVMLASAQSAASRLDQMREAPESYSKEEYLSTLEQSLFVHDRYIYAVQTARQVQSNFLADQTWISQADQDLVGRVNGLPTLVGSLGFDLTNEQWAGLSKSFDDVSDSLNRLDENLGRLAGGLKGGLLVLGSGAIIATSAAWAPVATAYAGATLFGTGLGLSVGTRLSAGQSAFEVVVGSAADTVGVTAMSVALAKVDPVTGDEVVVSPEEAGFNLVTGTASLVMLVSMPLANGLPGPTTRISLPKPSFADNFGVTAGGAVTVAPAITWSAAGVEVSHTGLAMASAYVGTTRVVVVMSSGGLPRGSSETPHERTAYEVGEQEGRRYAKEELGLSDTDFVNPFGNRGRTADASTGIDDVRIDAEGNLWVVEYKGGQSGLKGDQMQVPWLERKIEELVGQGEPFKTWAARLQTARSEGKLKGVAIHTEYSRGDVGQTSVIGTWNY